MSTTARRTAVSYSRFSAPKQSKGDSEDRQERDYKAFCEQHNLTPGKEVYVDRGRSGYHGEHRKKGRLGELIQAAKDGRFDPGTIIVIEAWDRLGRLRPDRQIELVGELLRTGVSIGVCRLNDIFAEADFGTHKWTSLAVFIQLAFQESQQKAERGSAAWASRRRRARENGEPVGGNHPAWVERVNDEFRLIPSRVAAIQRIYQLAADGFGLARIVKTLEEEKVKPFGERVVNEGRTRSQFAGHWTRAYVSILLRDRRVVGELQLYKGAQPDGEPVRDYFPAAVTEEQFALARAAQGGRRTSPEGPRGRQGKHVNVFQGLLTHARDGGSFRIHNDGKKESPQLYLRNASSIDGQSKQSYTFPYSEFEEAILKFLEEIKPDAILPSASAVPSQADTLRTKLAGVRVALARMQEELNTGFSKTLVGAIRVKEAEEVQFANALQDELARTLKPLNRQWEEVPNLIDAIRKSPDPVAARLKLHASLRAILDSAHVLIVPNKSTRFAIVQFYFVGGGRREWVIAHQSACRYRPGRVWSLSVSETIAAEDIDLRTKADVARLEKFFARVDVSKLGACTD